jgi:hypothetical protein
VKNDIDKKLDEIYSKAKKAIADKNYEEADFQIARYLGISATTKTEKSYKDMYSLYKEMGDMLKATAFISGQYDDSFKHFFFSTPAQMWAVPEEAIYKHKFVVRGGKDETGKYFCQFRMSPCLQKWLIFDKKLNQFVDVVPLGSGKLGPEIAAFHFDKEGKVQTIGKVELDKEYNIQCVWPIEFHNIDNDKIPEIFVRYNMAMGDGFTQRLDIYKIINDHELKLFQRFDGKSEGIARRLDDGNIETGFGFSDRNEGHLYFNKTEIDTWEYDGKQFKKTKKKIVPHILWDKGWTKYYFGNKNITQ